MIGVTTCSGAVKSPSTYISSSGLILSLSLIGVLAGVCPLTEPPSAAPAPYVGVAEAAGVAAPPGVIPPDVTNRL